MTTSLDKPMTPAPEAAPMVTVDITRDENTNALRLTINAKNLHDHLDSIGVPKETNGVWYKNRPRTDFQIAGNGRISTEMFLKRTYPNVVDLSSVFTTPPPFRKLAELAQSGKAVVASILDHYRPVDISVHVFAKEV